MLLHNMHLAYHEQGQRSVPSACLGLQCSTMRYLQHRARGYGTGYDLLGLGWVNGQDKEGTGYDLLGLGWVNGQDKEGKVELVTQE